jgi:hypothetical protein
MARHVELEAYPLSSQGLAIASCTLERIADEFIESTLASMLATTATCFCVISILVFGQDT